MSRRRLKGLKKVPNEEVVPGKRWGVGKQKTNVIPARVGRKTRCCVVLVVSNSFATHQFRLRWFSFLDPVVSSRSTSSNRPRRITVFWTAFQIHSPRQEGIIKVWRFSSSLVCCAAHSHSFLPSRQLRLRHADAMGQGGQVEGISLY